MAVGLRWPKRESGMQEAGLRGWLIEVGEQVERGAIIAEIETDKSTLEIEAPVSGTLCEVRIAAGTQAVPVGEVLGRIEPAQRTAEAAAASEVTGRAGAHAAAAAAAAGAPVATGARRARGRPRGRGGPYPAAAARTPSGDRRVRPQRSKPRAAAASSPATRSRADWL